MVLTEASGQAHGDRTVQQRKVAAAAGSWRRLGRRYSILFASSPGHWWGRESHPRVLGMAECMTPTLDLWDWQQLIKHIYSETGGGGHEHRAAPLGQVHGRQNYCSGTGAAVVAGSRTRLGSNNKSSKRFKSLCQCLALLLKSWCKVLLNGFFPNMSFSAVWLKKPSLSCIMEFAGSEKMSKWLLSDIFRDVRIILNVSFYFFNFVLHKKNIQGKHSLIHFFIKPFSEYLLCS